MYKITLADGTVLDNLELNGNNYISSTIIDSAIFNNNLSSIIVEDENESQTYTNMQLMGNRAAADGRSWFVLGEKTAQQLREEELQQKIDELTGAILELSSLVL